MQLSDVKACLQNRIFRSQFSKIYDPSEVAKDRKSTKRQSEPKKRKWFQQWMWFCTIEADTNTRLSRFRHQITFIRTAGTSVCTMYLLQVVLGHNNAQISCSMSSYKMMQLHNHRLIDVWLLCACKIAFLGKRIWNSIYQGRLLSNNCAGFQHRMAFSSCSFTCFYRAKHCVTMYQLVMQVKLTANIIPYHLQQHDLRAQMKRTICLNMACSVPNILQGWMYLYGAKWHCVYGNRHW